MLEYLLFLLKAKTLVPNGEIINCSFTEQISITHISIKPTDLKLCGKITLKTIAKILNVNDLTLTLK